ncbi:DNA topoisomerase IV, alpha subunit [Neoconidiobolus thromboides FSU 785]|nr:DNA topoisomerase IV, alpha subunit [Neoconidiobolus thromboides FSU 785]
MFILTDWDPFGIDIYCTYKFGSKVLDRTYQDDYKLYELKWLGIYHENNINRNMKSSNLNKYQNLNEYDLKKAYNLLKKDQLVYKEEIIRIELSKMLFYQKKHELQSMTVDHSTFDSKVVHPENQNLVLWLNKKLKGICYNTFI